MTSTETSLDKLGVSASELVGQQMLTQIFLASLAPYEMAVRMRKHFRIGHHYWTLIPTG